MLIFLEVCTAVTAKYDVARMVLPMSSRWS
jgi:hypothetical protein